MNKRARKAALFRNANLGFKEDGADMEDTEIDLFIREIATTTDNNVKNKKIVEVVDNENQEILHSKTNEIQDKKDNKFIDKFKKIFIKFKKLN